MSKQRYIQDSFWTDPYVETLNVEEKLLFLYFLTNPLCNIAGIYEIRDSRISYELSIPENKIKNIKNKLVKDGKLFIYKDWICIFNFAKHQQPNPNVRKGMQRIVDSLPSDLKALKGFERLSHFTLLNLTLLTADFSKEKFGNIINLKKTKMDIDYETGEVINEKPKTHKNEDGIRLAKLFDKMATDYSGKPIITPRSYFIVLSAMKNHKLKPKGIEQIYKDWFSNPKVKDENKVLLNWCLGKNNINSFKVLN